MSIVKRVLNFARREIVLSVSFVLAVISMLLVTPDKNYLSYIDWRTLAILYSLMAIMAGLQKLMVFRQLGELLIGKVHTVRGICLILVLLCFCLSMLITNDVALITFVPFTVIVLNMAKQREKLIPVIVMETVAANLGSMMMPMGNPQNLYLYSLSGMSLLHFIQLMLPYGALSLAMILVLSILFAGKEEVEPVVYGNYKRIREDKVRFGAYLALFAFSLLVVLRLVNHWIGLLVVVAVILVMDRRTLRRVDDTLLFTFFFLFIFIGNLKRISIVSLWLSGIVGGHEVLVSVLASQVISNVPAAILLSGFTQEIPGLILGTNFGGLGTLIASMASLISFKQYGNTEGAQKGRYLAVFTLVNVGMLFVIMAVYYCLGR